MQADDQHVETREENRIPNVLARAGAVLAAVLGLVVLVGWVLGLPLLSGPGPRWIPMAPSSALLFLLFGAAIFASAGAPVSRPVWRTAMVIGSVGTLAALLLFFLSWQGIHPDAEHFGMAIAQSATGLPIGHTSPLTALGFVLAGLSFLASLGSSPARPWHAAAGFCCAGVLVCASVVFLLGYLFGTPLLYGGQFIPPALTTSLAFAALGMALLALTGPRAWAPDERIDAATLRASRSFMLMFALLAAGLVSVGYVHFHDYEQHYRTEVERQLSAIAELKAGELAAWRTQRLADATVLFRNAVFAALVRRALGNPKDLEAQEQLHRWLRQVRDAYRYAHVSLTDTHGVARISIPDRPLPASAREHAREAPRSGRIVFLDFHRDAAGAAIRLSILIPIAGAKEGDRPLGVVVLDIDPGQYLYPFIQRWPTPSRSAETLLVRRDGNDVLFLNELRFRKNTALALRIPLDNRDVPAVQAVLGQERIVEGVDYRGVPVIAALRAVPGSPWFLIARVDSAEILDPITEHLWLIAGLIGALLLAAGAAVGLVWRHQRVRHYKERLRAAEALRESEARYRELFGGIKSGVAVYTAWQNGEDFVFTDINLAGEQLEKITKKEIVGRRVTEMFPGVVEFGLLDVLRRVWKTGQAEHHPVSFYRDKRITGWRENTVYRLASGDVVAVYDDVTERKQAEEALREALQRLKFHVDNSPLAVVEFDREFRVIFWSNVAQRVFGWSAEEILGKRIDQLRWVHEEDAARVAALSADMFAGHRTRNLHTNRNYRKDGSVITCEWYNSALLDSAGGLVSVLSLVVDITERKRAEEALRESEDRYRDLVENSQDLICTHDLEGRLLSVNAAAIRLTGYSREALLGMNLADLLTRGARDGFAAYLAEIRTKRAARGLMRIRTADGKARWWEYHNTLRIEGVGAPVVRGMAQDITERKRAEKALLESERKLRLIAENATDVIFAYDMNRRLIYVNPALEELTGYTVAELRERNFIDWSHPEDEAKMKALWEGLFAGKSYSGEEFRIVTKDGRIKWCSGSWGLLYDESGRQIGVQGRERDITERKQVDAALRESAERYRAMVEQSPYMIGVLVEGRLAYLNPAGLGLFGAVRPEQMLHKSIEDYLHPDDVRVVRERVRRATANGLPNPLTELRILRLDGTMVYIDGVSTPLVYRGQPAVQFMCRDITERKRAEEALRKTGKRLRDLSQRLIEVEDGVRRNINRELHDRVGANLSAINLNLSILGSQLPQKSLVAVGTRLQETQRLIEETTAHVRDLMADLHPPALDDYGLVAALRTYVHDLGARTAVPISVHGEPFAPRLPLAAETALFRVAQGALANAVAHAQAKRIEILIAATADRVTLTITDDGIGFDAAQAAQAHASWGLVIMRERAEAVGATLTVEAAPGKGTRVCAEIQREKR